MRSILEIQNLRGRTALVRVDYNIPLNSDGTVDKGESIRVEKSIDTIKHLSRLGARVILISHIGRDPKASLAPVVKLLETYVPVRFVPMLYHEDVPGIVENMIDGEVIMLENLRSDPREESNSKEFAAYLASLADLFVNEAFSASHREHASIVGVPAFLPSYAGVWFLEELRNLDKLMNPEKPFLCIIGGAKFETKLPVIEQFSKVADTLFVGGALANNFFKAIGFSVGASLVDPSVDVARFFSNESIKVPFDVVLKTKDVRPPNAVREGDVIADIGPDTLAFLKTVVASSKTILWNGPLGLYEEGFDETSRQLLQAISESGAFSVIGGGDTTKLAEKMGVLKKISFVSTGGGAMLQYLGTHTLPGIVAIDASLSTHG